MEKLKKSVAQIIWDDVKKVAECAGDGVSSISCSYEVGSVDTGEYDVTIYGTIGKSGKVSITINKRSDEEG